MKKTTICIIIVVIVVLIISVNFTNILKIFYKTHYQEFVEKYAKEYNVDSLLIYSIIKAESNFKEGAISNKGACGLMQLMDNTAKEVAENNVMEYESGTTLYNPEKNIKLGIIYFSDLMLIYKNEELALAAYNAGSGNVNKWIETGVLKADGSNIENIPYVETNTYVRKILRNYKIYKMLYNFP